jgi:hypothetical protein
MNNKIFTYFTTFTTFLINKKKYEYYENDIKLYGINWYEREKCNKKYINEELGQQLRNDSIDQY